MVPGTVANTVGKPPVFGRRSMSSQQNRGLCLPSPVGKPPRAVMVSECPGSRPACGWAAGRRTGRVRACPPRRARLPRALPPCRSHSVRRLTEALVSLAVHRAMSWADHLWLSRPSEPTKRGSVTDRYSSAYCLACLLPMDPPQSQASWYAASPMRPRSAARTASSCGARGT